LPERPRANAHGFGRELPPYVEIANSDVTNEDNEHQSAPIHPRFHEEAPVLKPPLIPDSHPVVIHHKEPVHHNSMAVTNGTIGALARLIGDKFMAHRPTLQGQIDHRLRQQINEKKLSMGIKTESTRKANYQPEEEHEQSMQKAKRNCGRRHERRRPQFNFLPGRRTEPCTVRNAPQRRQIHGARQLSGH